MASAPEGASTTNPRRPASQLPESNDEALLDMCSSRSLVSHGRLRIRFYLWLPMPLAQPFHQKLPIRSRGSFTRNIPVSLARSLVLECFCPRLRSDVPIPIRTGISPNRFPVAARRRLRSSDPCKALVLLWFPSAPPPPYRFETVTDRAFGKAGNGRIGLLIT